MESSVFERHERLKAFPPAQLIYILYRRFIEQGLQSVWLWIKDKVVRRVQGVSPPTLSQITRNLYVGGQHYRRGLVRMRKLGITAIVNMREEWDDSEHKLTLDHYLWLPTRDDTPPNLQALERGVRFIHQQISNGHGVYIHCASGVGRAPTMAAAYLVYLGATPERAWRTIRQRRPFIRPTPPQVEVIRNFARVQAAPTANSRNTADDRERIDAPSTEHHSVTSTNPPSNGGRSSGQTTLAGELRALAQQALERLAEDPTLTGGLTDDQARILLNWAERELQRYLDEICAHPDQDAGARLKEKSHDLRQHIRRIAELSAASKHPDDILKKLLLDQHSATNTDDR